MSATLSDIIPFDRERYYQHAQAHGLQDAVNKLHHDLWEVEQECFDTPNGYQADMWRTLNEMRLFSRELWDLKLNQQQH